jgi:hypothetical protein
LKKEEVKMRRLSLIVFLVCLMTSGAFATQTVWDFNVPAGLWSTPANWAVLAGYPALPADTGLTTDYVKVQGTKVCNLDSAAGNFPYTKLTVAGTTSGGGATLNITDGSIGTGNEFQVSDTGKTGIVVQTGGAVTTFQGSTAGKLEIGYKTGIGSWSISGGSISGTNKIGQIIVGGAGAAGAVGTFTVHGSAPVIDTNTFLVGTKDSTGAYPGTGTVKFELDGGVSPIKVAKIIIIDPTSAAACVANLVVALTDETVPAGDIVLFKNSSTAAVNGTFDTVTGDQSPWDRALEGDQVWLTTPLGVLHKYILTYQYNADAGTVANDVALVIPEPATIALLSLGLLLVRRNRK